MKNQKGFTAIELVLGAVLVIVIGIAGFVGFQHYKAAASPAATPRAFVGCGTTNHCGGTTATPSTSPSMRPSPSPTAIKKYLDITQLHVKFVLPSNALDTVYVMSGDGMSAYLSSTSLMSLQRQDDPAHATACDATNAPLGYVTEGSQGTGAQRTFVTAQSPCSGNGTVETYTVNQMNALSQAFRLTAVTY